MRISDWSSDVCSSDLGLRDDLLRRFGEFARSSAPTAAFTTIISTALAAASPPAAAKGIFAVAAAGGANTLGKVALGAAGSIGLAMVAAFAGLWLGLRKQLKGAIDDEERTALIRSSVINGLASIAFVACMLLVASGARGTLMPVSTIRSRLGFLAA